MLRSPGPVIQLPAGIRCAARLPTGSISARQACPTGPLDIGAFFVKRKPEMWFWSGDYEEGVDDLGYRELFVRWFQYGAFLPMFRAHGTDTPREIWRFGKPANLSMRPW